MFFKNKIKLTEIFKNYIMFLKNEIRGYKMIIEINKTLSKSEQEDIYEIIKLIVNLDDEVKEKLLYMILGLDLLAN